MACRPGPRSTGSRSARRRATASPMGRRSAGSAADGGAEPAPSAVIPDSRTLRASPESGERAGYDGAKRERGEAACDGDTPEHTPPAERRPDVAAGRPVELAEGGESCEAAGYRPPRPASPVQRADVAHVGDVRIDPPARQRRRCEHAPTRHRRHTLPVRGMDDRRGGVGEDARFGSPADQRVRRKTPFTFEGAWPIPWAGCAPRGGG